MSLDLYQVVEQVKSMISGLKAGSNAKQVRLEKALQILHDNSSNIDGLNSKIASSKTTWLVAALSSGLDHRFQAPMPITDFTVLASDGSHIDTDRHRQTNCYLINIGTVMLRYGSNPSAYLESTPRLYCKDEDMVIKAENGHEQPLTGPLLGIKRSIDEIKAISLLIEKQPAEQPVLALLDGTLILWGLEAFPDFISQAMLNNGLLKHMDYLSEISKSRQFTIASYISYPRATEVINTLRVALCPHETPDCDKFCMADSSRECRLITGVQDKELFSTLLGDRERSDVFISRSKVVEKFYRQHRIYFFYLKAGEEIARVEIPAWVAENKDLLELTHTLVLDQCKRGQGYPVALSEAHEKAVLTGSDRETFWQLVESALVQEGISVTGSGKSRSKRTRWI